MMIRTLLVLGLCLQAACSPAVCEEASAAMTEVEGAIGDFPISDALEPARRLQAALGGTDDGTLRILAHQTKSLIEMLEASSRPVQTEEDRAARDRIDIAGTLDRWRSAAEGARGVCGS